MKEKALKVLKVLLFLPVLINLLDDLGTKCKRILMLNARTSILSNFNFLLLWHVFIHTP